MIQPYRMFCSVCEGGLSRRKMDLCGRFRGGFRLILLVAFKINRNNGHKWDKNYQPQVTQTYKNDCTDKLVLMLAYRLRSLTLLSSVPFTTQNGQEWIFRPSVHSYTRKLCHVGMFKLDGMYYWWFREFTYSRIDACTKPSLHTRVFYACTVASMTDIHWQDEAIDTHPIDRKVLGGIWGVKYARIGCHGKKCRQLWWTVRPVTSETNRLETLFQMSCEI